LPLVAGSPAALVETDNASNQRFRFAFDRGERVAYFERVVEQSLRVCDDGNRERHERIALDPSAPALGLQVAALKVPLVVKALVYLVELCGKAAKNMADLVERLLVRARAVVAEADQEIVPPDIAYKDFVGTVLAVFSTSSPFRKP
jgi:hypothetical protein